MNLTFNPKYLKSWTLTDDKVVYGGRVIPLSAIKRFAHDRSKSGGMFTKRNGTITITFGSGSFDFVVLAYEPHDSERGEQAAQYIYDIHSEKAETSRKEGFRKRCTVCGKIFCYTFEDLEKNRELAKRAALSSVGGIAGGLSGNYAAGAVSNQSASDDLSRIVDYTKCPNCGSKNLVDATDEDIARMNTQQNGQSAISSADELKKFKELLDMGVITQEEFDAKKKQLLGL